MVIECEDLEAVFDARPELRREELSWSSELFSHLLWPHLRLRAYDGREGGLFADLREQFGVSTVFESLLEDDSLLVDARSLMADVVRIQGLIHAERARISPVYALRDVVGNGFVELTNKQEVIECGYDHCAIVSKAGDKLFDLRGESQIKFGGKELRVLRLATCELLEPELRQIFVVLRSALNIGTRIALRSE